MPKKGKGIWAKRGNLMIVVVFISSLVFGGYYLLSFQSNMTPNSFEYQVWMSFIPAEVERFRFLNITELTGFPGLFTNTVVLSIPELELNISVYELGYGLEIETPGGSVVNILGINTTVADGVARALARSSFPSVLYKNATIYQIKTSPTALEDTAWISVFSGDVIYCEGSDLALQAVESVIDTSANQFFSIAVFKEGYLRACEDERCLAFSYFKFEESDLKIKWAMISLFGSSQLTKREVFYFASKDDAANKYQEVVRSLLLNARHVYSVDNFILGEFVYSSSEIRSAIMGM